MAVFATSRLGAQVLWVVVEVVFYLPAVRTGAVCRCWGRGGGGRGVVRWLYIPLLSRCAVDYVAMDRRWERRDAVRVLHRAACMCKLRERRRECGDIVPAELACRLETCIGFFDR